MQYQFYVDVLLEQLLKAPHFKARDDFDPATCRLPEIPSEIWQGFIFVNLAQDPPPLTPRLAALEERIGHYHFEEMRLRYVSEEVWDTNWKCLMENFMEGYHLSALHRKSLHRLSPTKLCEHFPPGDGYFGFYSGFPAGLQRNNSSAARFSSRCPASARIGFAPS